MKNNPPCATPSKWVVWWLRRPMFTLLGQLAVASRRKDEKVRPSWECVAKFQAVTSKPLAGAPSCC